MTYYADHKFATPNGADGMKHVSYKTNVILWNNQEFFIISITVDV